MGLTHLADRWAQLNDLFHQACELPPEARAEFCRASCGSDQELCAFLTELVTSAEIADATLREEIGELAQEISVSESLEGQRVGAYKIDSLLAHGGMGEVYLASRADGEFEKTVAIKILRKRVNKDEIARHFRTERQVLANLSHPCIPALVDAGQLEDGRPYFVCDYIDGQPVDVYCDEHELSTSQKLRLLTRAGEVLQHAHTNLVLHLDIKPDNILVVKDGSPRLLDFGVARLMGEREQGLKAFTPEYASPEQIRGEPLSAASDVYSLGLLMYRLLAGDSPLSSGRFAPSETRMAEREAFAEKIIQPDALGDMHPDLRAVIHKATADKPTDRYASVDALLLDLRNHQRHLPVTARKQTLRYRSGRFFRRHALAVGVTSIVIMLLTAFGVHEAELRKQAESAFRKAVESERVAEHNAETARQISTFMTDLFQVSEPGITRGGDVTARELLDHGAQRVGRDLQAQPRIQSRLMTVIGDVYQRLGLYDEALTQLESAVRIKMSLPDYDAAELGEALAITGNVHMRKGRYDAAQAALMQSLELREQAYGINHPDVAGTLTLLGVLYTLKSDFSTAESFHVRAIDIYKNNGDNSGEALANSIGNLAMTYAQSGRLEKAEQLYLGTITVEENLLGANAPTVATRSSNLADIYQLMGRFDEAVKYYQKTLLIHQKILPAGDPRIATDLDNLGRVHLKAGRVDEAEAVWMRALAIREAAFYGAHPQVAASLGELGLLYAQSGRPDMARDFLKRALNMSERVYPPGDAVISDAKLRYSEVLLQQKEWRQAEQLAIDVIAEWQASQPPDRDKLEQAEWHLAAIYRDQGRYNEAGTIYSRVFSAVESRRPVADATLTQMAEVYEHYLRLAGHTQQAEALAKRMAD